MFSLIEKLSIYLYKHWLLSFQQKAIVLVLVAMTTDFEHKLNCADELDQPLKSEANPLRAYPDIKRTSFP